MNDPGITKEQYLNIARKFGFTKRELELGYLKVSGFSNHRIAYMLGISEQTVKKFQELFTQDGCDYGEIG